MKTTKRLMIGAATLVILAGGAAGLLRGTYGQDSSDNVPREKRAAPRAGAQAAPQPGGGLGSSAPAGGRAGFSGNAFGAPGMGRGAPGMGGGWAGPPDELAMKDSELEGTVHTFLQMYSAAENDNDRAEIRENLTKTLVEQFAIRQQRREREIAEIEARVKRLRDALKKRADAKQKIIEQRLNELLSDAEGLGWGDAGASGFAPPGGGRFGFGGAGVFGQSGAAPGAAPPRE